MGPLNPENSSKQDLDDSGYVQDASATENGSKGYAQLLDLSDDVLLYILQYLTPRDLKALGHTCPRLGILICDRTLWVKVDHRSWPVGEQRLRWLLTHGLCATTTELKLSGYANKYSRCLGIQDTLWPEEVDQNCIRGTCVGPQQDGSVDSVDVEHFLLRMWYPHLPRCLISPRWPDKAEVDRRKVKVEEERKKAAEAAASKSGEASTSSGKNEGSSPPSSSSSTQNLSSIEYDSVKCDELPVSSSSDTLNQQAGCSSEKSSKSDQKPSCSSRNSGINTSNASQYSESSESKKEKNAFLFEDDNCKGPQFSLTMNLMRDLKKKCSHLTSLALEYCNLDYKTTNIRHFPIHLKKLSLRGSRCYNLPLNVSYLGKVQQRLPELEYLDVSECEWFEPASLMPLSKLPVLAELYMRDCRRLNECVAYASLSSRYGFKKLKVIDVRGSPLADSEVSALGWLPLLEELYMSPPDDFAGLSEHTHTWADINTVFTELDSWETEEPDYYKVKSPEPEHEEEDKEDETDNDRQGEVIFNNPWWAHERRIIVIQPNARQELEQRFPPRPRQPGNEEDENGPGEARQAPRERQPDPRPGPVEPQPGPAEPQPGPAEPQPGPADPQPGPAEPQAGPAEPQPGPAEPQPGPANPRQAVLYPLPYQMGNIDIVPIGNPPKPLQDVLDEVLLPIAFNPRSLREHGWGPASPENPQPGPSNQEPGPSSPQPGPASPQPGPSNAQPGPESPGEGTSKRRLSGDDAIDLAKRRRLVDDEEGEQPAPPPVEPVPAPAPANFPPYNPLLCRRFRIAEVPAAPENEPERPDMLPGVRFRRHDLRHVMQIDVDIHRQSSVTVSSHVGNQLVTDSSLLRLGRAENENVNYIHIGRYGVHHGSESGSRPDRSNLRILSVTGYRGITDRSLEHLVTAAPNLVYLDFTETNVTARGVEMFKAIKPDCEVIFSQFGRMM